jgi:hypothetical protein
LELVKSLIHDFELLLEIGALEFESLEGGLPAIFVDLSEVLNQTRNSMCVSGQLEVG